MQDGNMTQGNGMHLDFSRNRIQGHVSNVNSQNTNVPVYGQVYGNLTVNSPSEPSSRRKKAANWLSPLDFSSHQSQALEKRTHGTLEWLLVLPEFRHWRNKRGEMLWCPGHPGAGKTVFAGFVIDHLQKARRDSPHSVGTVCYIYCEYGVRLTVLQIFEVILKQLILSCPTIDISEITEMMDQGRRLPLDEIILFLQSSFRHLSTVFIIIDALDECFEEPDRHSLIQRMRSLEEVNILMTSRPLPSIQSMLGGITKLNIYAADEDIETHLSVQSELNPQLSKLMGKVPSKQVVAKLLEKADGMFLLADRHIVYLAQQTNDMGFMTALDTLPADATASHASALGRINQLNPLTRRLAYTVLSLVSFALRPLKLIELQHAIANTTLDRLPTAQDLDDEERILSISAGLVNVNKGSHQVGFLHYTVQEYLERLRDLDESELMSESHLTKSLMKYIALPGLQADSSIHPLVEYAASAWGPHIKRCEDSDSVVDMALSLLANPAQVNIVCSIHIPNPLREYSGGQWDLSRFHPVHLVAVFGLTKTGKAFLKRHPRYINKRDSDERTPLSWAAGNGHLETVWMLLQVGKVVHNAAKQKTVLRVIKRETSSAIRTLPGVLKLDVNAKDRWGQTPLSWAARNGHTEVVKMLLATGKVDVDVKGEGGRTPFSWAARQGNTDIVKMLLDTGKVDVDVKNKAGQTPLSWAAGKGHAEVVKLVLDTGKVDVDALDDDRKTPLLRAAESGHAEVVKMLLATGEVDVEARDKSHETPLSLAARNGRADVVQLLVDTGKVRIDRRTKHGTPLMRAVRKGHIEVVRILLATGKANPDAKIDDKHDARTALSLARAYNQQEIIQLLKNHPRP